MSVSLRAAIIFMIWNLYPLGSDRRSPKCLPVDDALNRRQSSHLRCFECAYLSGLVVASEVIARRVKHRIVLVHIHREDVVKLLH